MFKTQLSNNLVEEKVVIAVVPVLTFFSFSMMPLIITILVFLLMIILVPYSICTIYMAHLNISYDASFVFITDRKTEKIITLKSISRIQPAPGSLRKRWQITYNDNGAEEELYFYPKDGSASLTQFIRTVKVQNPMVSSSGINSY